MSEHDEYSREQAEYETEKARAQGWDDAGEFRRLLFERRESLHASIFSGIDADSFELGAVAAVLVVARMIEEHCPSREMFGSTVADSLTQMVAALNAQHEAYDCPVHGTGDGEDCPRC